MRSKAVLFALCLSFLSHSGYAETSTGPITVLTIIDVVPDYAIPDNVAISSSLLAKLAEDTQHAPGAISFKILRDAARPNHFVIFSFWEDMRAFAIYSGSDTTKAFRQALQPRQGGPFDERVYVDLK